MLIEVEKPAQNHIRVTQMCSTLKLILFLHLITTIKSLLMKHSKRKSDALLRMVIMVN